MKAIASALALVLGVGACTKQVDQPRIDLSDVGFTLHLPPAMKQALDSVAPGFRSVMTSSFRSDVSQAAVAGGGGVPALFATVGDFDHDGTTDAVVEGTAPGDSSLQVIAVLNGKTPRAVEVTEFPVYDADAVGIYLTGANSGKAGAFEVVDYPDSTLLYRYSNGGFTGTNIGN